MTGADPRSPSFSFILSAETKGFIHLYTSVAGASASASGRGGNASNVEMKKITQEMEMWNTKQLGARTNKFIFEKEKKKNQSSTHTRSTSRASMDPRTRGNRRINYVLYLSSLRAKEMHTGAGKFQLWRCIPSSRTNTQHAVRPLTTVGCVS